MDTCLEEGTSRAGWEENNLRAAKQVSSALSYLPVSSRTHLHLEGGSLRSPSSASLGWRFFCGCSSLHRAPLGQTPFLAKSGQTSVCFFLHCEGRREQHQKGRESLAASTGTQSWAPSGGTNTLLKEEKDVLVLPSPYRNTIPCQNIIKNNALLWETLHAHPQLSKCLVLWTQTTKVLTAMISPQGGDAGRAQRG